MKKLFFTLVSLVFVGIAANAQAAGGSGCTCGGTCSTGGCTVSCNSCQQPFCEDGWFGDVCKCVQCGNPSASLVPETYQLALDANGASKFESYLAKNALSAETTNLFKGYVASAKTAKSNNDYLAFVSARDNINRLADSLTGSDKTKFDTWFESNGFIR